MTAQHSHQPRSASTSTTHRWAKKLLVVGTCAAVTLGMSAPAQAQPMELIDQLIETGDLEVPAELAQVTANLGQVAAAASDLPPAITALIGRGFLNKTVTAHVEAVTTPEGTRYRITPGDNVQKLPFEARYAGWIQAVENGVPDTPSLRHQYYCHFDGRSALKNKPTWNLEDWRADKGMEGFYRSLCN